MQRQKTYLLFGFIPLYKSKKDENGYKKYILGIPYASFQNNAEETVKRSFFQIFKKKKSSMYSKYYFLGIQIWCKKKSKINILMDRVDDLQNENNNLKNELQQNIQVLKNELLNSNVQYFNYLSPEWEKFVINTYNYNELVSSMDIESKRLARIFMSRQFTPYSFSPQEKANLEITKNIDLSKYIIKNKYGFQPELFWSRAGLSFLDVEVVQKNLEGRCIIDGGACSGDSTIMFAENYPYIDKIYSFEPMKKIYEDMKKTLELNNIHNAIAVNMALSNKCEEVEIANEICQTISIDEFAKDKKVGCIKLDLEGMESKAIQGAIETIKRDKPILLICVYHTPNDFFNIKPLIDSLNLGYNFILRDTEPCNSNVGIHLMLIGYVP